ncbi:MAG: LuxR family transcriptional regulator [Alphaproteobacteria bacterium HGW-Alphaproteobacteria-2]|nr:MAG: LuxR family transcriptional regulator [Alphaproteobacteria bacterium HGW-Alphaproteobacteria-2]
MTALTRYLRTLTEAETLDEAWRLHVAKMADYGFDRLLYGYTRHLTPSSTGDIRDAVVLSNHSREYLAGYIGRGLYRNAPMLAWARANTRPVSWALLDAWMAEGRLSAAECAVVAFNRRLGVVAGYSISFREVSPRFGGVVSLCARAGMTQAEVETLWAREGETIVLLNNVAHLKFTRLPCPNGRRLTRRQREVLEWVADGKTMQEAALILGVSPGTVEKHLRNAREALGAGTTAQALVKAAMANQVFTLRGLEPSAADLREAG